MDKKYLGRNVWGPKAWHLLHAFSIGMNKPIKPEERRCYFLFYKSFAELIPCSICKRHYIEYFYHTYTIDEKEINRENMKKYVYELHNIVNKELGKSTISYKNALQLHRRTIHQDIFFFMNHAILQYLKLDLSLEEFDAFYTFFICFCKLYPDSIFRKKLQKVVECPSFKKIKTPSAFLNWYSAVFIHK